MGGEWGVIDRMNDCTWLNSAASSSFHWRIALYKSDSLLLLLLLLELTHTHTHPDTETDR